MALQKWVNEYSEHARISLSAIVKIILILSVAYALYYHLWRILFINLLLLIIIFIPTILKKYEIQIPKEIEFIVLLFVIMSFFLGDIRGIIIQIFFGVVVGFVGFTIMLILYSKSKIKANYFLIIIFSLSLSIALGLIMEFAKFYMKIFFKLGVYIADYQYAMISLTMVSIGALLASFIGYVYMKGHKTDILDRLVKKFKKQNPNLFFEQIDFPEDILKMIDEGESEKLEFKATLRTNLYTGEFDKKIELATLKTLTAFLNTEGGTLLIGVSDNKTILGVRDNFSSDDKFILHFTNLIKEHIGNEHLPYLNFKLISLQGKKILKVDCMKSFKPVFLKIGKEEEFYIRVGSASTQITGSKLVEYIKNNFK